MRQALRSGEVLPTLHFEPIGKAHVWEMAALARDFNPLQLFSESDPDGSKAPAQLHSLWLTSLVELGIRTLIPGALIRELVMEYGSPARPGHPSALIATVLAVREGDETVTLDIRMAGPRRETLATGRARIGFLNPDS